MVIKLKARHFLFSTWNQCQECPVAKATKEALVQYNIPFRLIREKVNRIQIDFEYYKHRRYSLFMYLIDRMKAAFFLYGNTTIREITIEGYPPVDYSKKTPTQLLAELELTEQESFN